MRTVPGALFTAFLLSYLPLSGDAAARSAVGPTARVQVAQAMVDDFRARLAIPDSVVVVIVPHNDLVVSVERLTDRTGFRLSVEEEFLGGLTDEELGAVVAHELGHVWIFTHHPYLQTEELANQIAMRMVDRETLEHVYAKVWQRIGVEGKLTYLPPK